MRLPVLTTLAAVWLSTGLGAPDAAFAATKSARKPPVKAPAKPAAKPAAKSAPTKATAAPMDPAAAFTEAQIAMANQVQIGRADCEFKQYVMIERVHPEGGNFRVKHQSVTYTMVPEETSTGAVRLYDKKTGVVWLQIPVKSMLMNSKAGRRERTCDVAIGTRARRPDRCTDQAHPCTAPRVADEPPGRRP